MIDEAQDISRYGLEVIKVLLSQEKPSVTLVADCRQSLLDSSLSSSKNKQYDRLDLLTWYENLSKGGKVTIRHLNEAYRYNQQIATFADSIFSKITSFPKTTSLMTDVTDHDGIFIVEHSNFREYCDIYNPTLLRSSKSSKGEEGYSYINFGASKGRTFDRVGIVPTGPIEKFLQRGEPLAQKSACAFYVAVTRARYSVAIFVKKITPEMRENKLFSIWTPKR